MILLDDSQTHAVGRAERWRRRARRAIAWLRNADPYTDGAILACATVFVSGLFALSACGFIAETTKGGRTNEAANCAPNEEARQGFCYPIAFGGARVAPDAGD